MMGISLVIVESVLPEGVSFLRKSPTSPRPFGTQLRFLRSFSCLRLGVFDVSNNFNEKLSGVG